MIDISPADAAEEGRRARIADQTQPPRGTIIIDLWDGKGLSAIPQGELHAAVSRFVHQQSIVDPKKVLAWAEQQRIGLRTFFGLDKAAGLDISKQLEKLREKPYA